MFKSQFGTDDWEMADESSLTTGNHAKEMICKPASEDDLEVVYIKLESVKGCMRYGTFYADKDLKNE